MTIVGPVCAMILLLIVSWGLSTVRGRQIESLSARREVAERQAEAALEVAALNQRLIKQIWELEQIAAAGLGKDQVKALQRRLMGAWEPVESPMVVLRAWAGEPPQEASRGHHHLDTPDGLL